MQRGQVVLVDTNIIIEAFRAHCWNAVTTHFTVETVKKCYEEALTGDPLRPDYIAVDAAQLRVTLAYEEGLDAGEGALSDAVARLCRGQGAGRRAQLWRMRNLIRDPSTWTAICDSDL